MKTPTLIVNCTGEDIFIEFVDGTKIAKRGHPGTAEAGTWINLHPNYIVTSAADQNIIGVELKPDQGTA